MGRNRGLRSAIRHFFLHGQAVDNRAAHAGPRPRHLVQLMPFLPANGLHIPDIGTLGLLYADPVS